MVATPRGHGNTNILRAHANPAVSSPSDVTSHRHFEPRSDHGGINSEGRRAAWVRMYFQRQVGKVGAVGGAKIREPKSMKVHAAVVELK
jgi:hypothetical protein